MNALIIEDDIVLALQLKQVLKNQPNVHRVNILDSYQAYIQESHTLESYDIALIDISLGSEIGGKTGIDIIQLIRKKNMKIPLIIISGFSDTDWIQKGFSVGANDYLVKPFRLKELEIRMMRWFQDYFCSISDVSYPIVCYQDLHYDISKNSFFYKEQLLSLSKIQKHILSLLISKPETLISYTFLKEKIWGDIFQVVERNLYIHLFRLKRTLETYGIVNRIQIVRGEGCMLIVPK